MSWATDIRRYYIEHVTGMELSDVSDYGIDELYSRVGRPPFRTDSYDHLLYEYPREEIDMVEISYMRGYLFLLNDSLSWVSKIELASDEEIFVWYYDHFSKKELLNV